MYSLLLIIAIIVCVLLVLIVLIQNPKGGGLSSNFSSSSQLMGVQKTGDFLEKGTWILAISLMVLSMAINVAVKGGTEKSDNSQLKEQVDKASKPTPVQQGTPATFPGAGTKKTK
ncbi:preprotein translocase subunit SecG [Mucilaginibacter sp.]|uniref:preprotein translocase subunit SecG n=1 Tax=Mucilaginibacter sp. TaxID=1882438 RepID=UPI002603966A|nr:preprotein translocase subunit SecG [Mucilaginibacter sp.]MDB4922365.1 preprotein translocase subunit SecG [Mucilaginibacter sp.]